MTKIISNAEIKVLLGIDSTSQDNLIELLNNQATEMMLDILNIASLTSHSVTDEEVTIYDQNKIVVDEFIIDTTGTITIKDSQKTTITGYTFELVNNSIKTLRVLDSDGTPACLDYDKIFIDYTAGYTTQETIEVLDYSTLANKTLNVYVAGTLTEWTFKASGATGNQINAETSNDVTATNIATALGGTASGAVVTLPLGTRTELGTATATELTITAATIPKALQNAVAMMTSGGIAQSTKKGNVTEYTIGAKTVKFGGKTNEEAAANGQSVMATFEYFIPQFMKVDILGV